MKVGILVLHLWQNYGYVYYTSSLLCYCCLVSDHIKHPARDTSVYVESNFRLKTNFLNLIMN